jgi:hypothetical protein
MDRDVVAVNIVIITSEITDRAGRRASVGALLSLLCQGRR